MTAYQEKNRLEFFIDPILRRNHGLTCTGLHGADRAYFVFRLRKELGIPIFVVLPSVKEGEKFLEDLDFFITPKTPGHILSFPPYNILPFQLLSYHNETAARRIRTLYRIVTDEAPPIVILTAEVLLQKLIPKKEIFDYAELILPGKDIERDRLVSKLVSGGYAPSVLVEEPGDFCVRGGILDIFCPLYPDPLRIELYGDTVDSVRCFSAATQRTMKTIHDAVILPAREVILKPDDLDPFMNQVKDRAYHLDLPEENIAELMDRIQNEGAFPGTESLISLIYPQLDTLFDYAPDHALFILTEPAELEAAANEFRDRAIQNYITACNESRLCVEPDALYLEWDEVKERLEEKKPLEIKGLKLETENLKLETGDLGLETGDLGLETGDSGLETGDSGLETGDLGLETGDWGLETGDLGLETGDLGLETGNLELETGELEAETGDWSLETQGMEDIADDAFQPQPTDTSQLALPFEFEPSKFPVSSFEPQVSKFPASNIKHQTPSIQHPASSIKHPASTIQFQISDHTDLIMALKHAKETETPILPLVNWLAEKQRSEYLTLFVCRGRLQAERLTSLLHPYGIQLALSEEFPETQPDKGMIRIVLGRLSAGFVWPTESLAIITENEIFGTRPRRKKPPKPKVHTDLLTFEELKQGDLVVHMEHGIGRYEGLVKLNGTGNDFLLIVYKDDDKLYLPVDRMSMVQKYMGVEGFQPVLDQLGGKSWERVKSRVKKSVEKMAGDLLNLYAARKVRQGYAFGHPDDDFRDFEAGFPYEETDDQLRAIEDVLQDMQASTPMDRLVCGDVGYGKTEVALRASLLTVSEGKQVAVLVPTTVLAEQHAATFSERFKAYPVNTASLSRFRTAKEQRIIINGLKEGKTDIVIGTHRLLQKDVAFKDLGLVVVDEEQRFGVKHKEKLKKLRTTVDVLALTATPIPRTLHLSLMGIRDISIISTPPEHRHAIVTYISEFDEAVIREAIRRELRRDGQIFFVHNHIGNIGEIALRLKKLTPEVRLDIAHGRMNETELERVMLRFMRRETDMLVCTTIIESGIDIPSANTILINRADRFGLAQIYQLRGRVGRSDEQAYAYLFIPSEAALTRDAQKRLKVLMEHSDLGAGFQIAMSDLKIRGGGTILGASQSGHIAAVGYDMFMKLMETAVSEAKGERVREALEPEINVNLSAFISESYIPDIDQRLSAYRRLAKMRELKDISDFKAELIDRYGELPSETANLLLKIMLKVMSVKAGVKRLDLTDEEIHIAFSEAHQENPAAIADMVSSGGNRFTLTPDYALKVRLIKRGEGTSLAQGRNVLKEIARRVNR